MLVVVQFMRFCTPRRRGKPRRGFGCAEAQGGGKPPHSKTPRQASAKLRLRRSHQSLRWCFINLFFYSLMRMPLLGDLHS
jgi:hypothetical protein